MDINRENFDEYVEAAMALAGNECYRQALAVAREAYSAWVDLNDTNEELMIYETIELLTHCELMGSETADELALLSDSLKSQPYWSDEHTARLPEPTQASVYRQKALAYLKLVDEWATGPLKDIYIDHAIDYMTRAIDKMEELLEEYPMLDFQLQQCKIEMVIILNHRSVKHARDYSMLLAGEITDQELKNDLASLYERITERLFQEFFRYTPYFTVQNAKDLSESVREDICVELLADYERDDDPYWWTFTHKVDLEDRTLIRIVDKFSDAQDNDFDKIPWVFTTDLIPPELEFEPGHPQGGYTYEVDSYNPELYHLSGAES